MPKVSIVVPVYNVRDYLDECVQSILAQSFSDFEVLLVDDGSTDGCGALCDAYAGQDKRFRVIHKENGGLASAVKRGVEESCGEFLFFVDSDDEVSPGGLEALLAVQKETGAALVCAWCISDREKVMGKQEGAHVRVFTHEEMMEGVLSTGKIGKKILQNSRCGKLFSAKRVKENLAYYDPAVRKGEDLMMTLPLYLTEQAIPFVEGLYPYYYRQRPTSICGKYDDKLWEKLLRRQEQVDKILEKFADRDLRRQRNNALISSAYIAVSSLKKTDASLWFMSREIQKILREKRLREAFSDYHLEDGGTDGLILKLMKMRQSWLLALLQKRVRAQIEKQATQE